MRSKTLAVLLTAITFQFSSADLLAQTPRASDEYEVKAAFLYNFAIYTEWPTVPPEAFDFCVLGADPFDSHLNKISRKLVQGKAIHVRYIKPLDDLIGCHLLFVPVQEKEQYYRIASFIKQHAILTVTDAPQLDEKWPMIMITLVPKGDLYTFDIDLTTAKTVGLTLSSKLLRLARNVK